MSSTENEGLPKIPNLELAQLKFVYSKETNKNAASAVAIKEKILGLIVKDSNSLFRINIFSAEIC